MRVAANLAAPGSWQALQNLEDITGVYAPGFVGPRVKVKSIQQQQQEFLNRVSLSSSLHRGLR